jgi:hypothetical protein
VGYVLKRITEISVPKCFEKHNFVGEKKKPVKNIDQYILELAISL